MQNELFMDGFIVLGDHPALDFVNTKPMMKGTEQELVSDFEAVVRWFAATGLLTKARAEALVAEWAGTPRAEGALREIRDFRERLRHALAAVEKDQEIPESAIQDVNAILAKRHASFRLVRQEGGLAKRAEFPAEQPEDLLGLLANAAADLYATADLSRLRKCETCVLYFHDRTKNGKRRWCSMQFCGNRAKVAAYSARQRVAGRR